MKMTIMLEKAMRIWKQNEEARAEAFANKPPTQQKIYHPE
jgi:hypothetical protein